MTYEDLVWQFTEDLDFDALKPWCDILDVDYEEPPLDDMYPDWEAELRTELAEAMMEIGEKPNIGTQMADAFDKIIGD